jgi:hypothetical protein
MKSSPWRAAPCEAHDLPRNAGKSLESQVG